MCSICFIHPSLSPSITQTEWLCCLSLAGHGGALQVDRLGFLAPSCPFLRDWVRSERQPPALMPCGKGYGAPSHG